MSLVRPFFGFWCIISIVTSSGAVEVPLWQPRDFSFPCDESVENPFLVGFSATVTGPDGSKFEIPGFHDGKGVWKIRVAPTKPGPWSIMTRSDRQALDRKSAAFTCAPNPNSQMRGGLRVDREHPGHFIRDDGSRFFPLGYECDWLWALDLGKPDIHATERFLDKISSRGFNYVILNTYAHDTGWRAGKTGDDDYGPAAAYPWGGSNENPDHSRLNLPYWAHYDRVMQALADRGIVAHMLIKVYNKKVRWPARGSQEDGLFFRTLVARYSAFPNVVWDFAKEAHNEKDLAYKVGRIKFTRSLDPYHRLFTVHDDNPAYEQGTYDEILDYRSDQQHSRWRETLLGQRAKSTWPLLNVEFGYEQGPKGPEDKTYRNAQSAEEVATRAWEVSLAGAYTVYYYTYTAWDVFRPDDNPPGYAYFQNLRDFFQTTGYWRLEPTDGIAGNAPCLAEPGREYVVFQRASAPVALKVEGTASPLPAEWFHPFTAEKLSAGMLGNGSHVVALPKGWEGGPAVLHVGVKPATD